MRQMQLAAEALNGCGHPSVACEPVSPGLSDACPADRAYRGHPYISIIVPTIDEASNLEPLTRRIAAAMNGSSYEVLIIDDGSADGTVDVCRELARTHPLALHVRSAPTAGLSGAVLYGFARARGSHQLRRPEGGELQAHDLATDQLPATSCATVPHLL